MPKKDLKGQRFGRLTVIRENGRANNRKVIWYCQCDCGGIAEKVTGTNLINGTTTSCGCYNIERIRQATLKHGQCNKTSEYHTWATMIQRCYNPKSGSYQWYGAIGIKVCRRWRNSFGNFFADMGLKPSKSHSLDRVNPQNDYSPKNCRWATPKQQGRNRREHVKLTINGRTECVAYWAEISGLDPKTIYARIKIGWSDYDAAFAPVQQLKRKNNVSHELHS